MRGHPPRPDQVDYLVPRGEHQLNRHRPVPTHIRPGLNDELFESAAEQLRLAVNGDTYHVSGTVLRFPLENPSVTKTSTSRPDAHEWASMAPLPVSGE
ncbi:hypothetical protein C731_3397 [Mycolicibacterium hassiacum DSM 44199]|uniref:Uncharacterized protein n=1 Tax=Mycolicibacterium hassiacum (strain DSM 44199 / CIP 105218 / JCM 12690 / 3849) TaxID=1122247 RepID=K5BE34_MYCHD|nr:hypothetical protein C731_3397 [Mycolicibacterium hassiacum DSM 44199]